MKIYNNDNTQLIEVMEGLSKGFAINQTFRTNHYEFYKENIDTVLVRIDGDTVGHLQYCPFGTFEQLYFENWDNEKFTLVEWLDEIDAELFNYEV